MGLLDDAIRDHLDLKRRRGADPSEVERAEREALGPVRRNPTPSELAEADAMAEAEAIAEGAAPSEAAAAYDQADEEGWSHDSVQEPPADAGVRRIYDEPPAEPEPAPAPREFSAPEAPRFDEVRDPLAGEPFEDEPFDDEEPFEEEPAREAFREPPAAPPAVSAGPETAEYNVEDALAAEEQHTHGGDDDVLEETPEFLQDTPDHDRLWFEQRPPKDFDFDE
jgi:hypothetical protein